LELVILEGGGKHTYLPVRSPWVSLGRLDPGESPGPDAVLFPEPTVSKLHATLEWDGNKRRFLLTHRSATNPTVVNGARVTRPTYVNPGDRVQMGKLVFELRIGKGQHTGPEIGSVDVPAMIRALRATETDAVHWVAHTPIPATPAATPIPSFAHLPIEHEVIPPEPIPLPPPETVAPEPEPAEVFAAAEATAEKPPVAVKATPYRRTTPKIGRNERCPCGSGRKYKKCCGAAA
jgi:predicted component of type VI protein secretion system